MSVRDGRFQHPGRDYHPRIWINFPVHKQEDELNRSLQKMLRDFRNSTQESVKTMLREI
jgi:hypothetical protein